MCGAAGGGSNFLPNVPVNASRPSIDDCNVAVAGSSAIHRSARRALLKAICVVITSSVLSSALHIVRTVPHPVPHHEHPPLCARWPAMPRPPRARDAPAVQARQGGACWPGTALADGQSSTSARHRSTPTEINLCPCHFVSTGRVRIFQHRFSVSRSSLLRC